MPCANASADRPVKVPTSRARLQRSRPARKRNNAYSSLASIITAGSPSAAVSSVNTVPALPYPTLCART